MRPGPSWNLLESGVRGANDTLVTPRASLLAPCRHIVAHPGSREEISLNLNRGRRAQRGARNTIRQTCPSHQRIKLKNDEEKSHSAWCWRQGRWGPDAARILTLTARARTENLDSALPKRQRLRRERMLKQGFSIKSCHSKEETHPVGAEALESAPRGECCWA